MTEYHLKVGACDNVHRLSGLTPVNPGGPTLGVVTLLARNSNTGVGDASGDAATIYLKKDRIKKIHDRVKNGRNVRIKFSVSDMDDVCCFTDSHSS